MAAPLAERALCEIECRLKRIRAADGFATDAGRSVFRSRRRIDANRCPAASVWDAGEQVTNGGGSSDAYDVVLRASVEVHVVADQDATGHVLELAKADVKRALLRGSKGALGDSPDRAGYIGTLAYTGCIANPREEGATTESVSMTFEVRYREGYGNPYGSQIEETT